MFGFRSITSGMQRMEHDSMLLFAQFFLLASSLGVADYQSGSTIHYFTREADVSCLKKIKNPSAVISSFSFWDFAEATAEKTVLHSLCASFQTRHY